MAVSFAAPSWPSGLVKPPLPAATPGGGPTDNDDARTELLVPFEAEIRAFEKLDRAKRPQPLGILFVGSSSIRLWDVQRYFPNYTILNRGFGGSQMSDLLQYAHRIVWPYRPRIVVVYEGDNDIAAGESAAQVVKEFQRFATQLAQQLPTTQLVYISIKPSPARWSLYPEMQQANRAIQEYCAGHAQCHFVDVSTVMLGEDGQPLVDLFQPDGLHLNEQGYVLWSRVVEPYLAVP